MSWCLQQPACGFHFTHCISWILQMKSVLIWGISIIVREPFSQGLFREMIFSLLLTKLKDTVVMRLSESISDKMCYPYFRMHVKIFDKVFYAFITSVFSYKFHVYWFPINLKLNICQFLMLSCEPAFSFILSILFFHFRSTMLCNHLLFAKNLKQWNNCTQMTLGITL